VTRAIFEGPRHELLILVAVLQPGRYRLVLSGQADAGISVKHLQISTIAGRTNTGRNRRSATLDQLVLVRIQVRQLKEYLQNRQNTGEHGQ
jgi:hypothetical protein